MNGRIYKRGGVWWIDYWHRGKRIRESSHSTKKREAGDLLRRRLEEMGRGRLIGPSAEKLSLEDIAFSLENTEYEPESFPGLVFRLPEPRAAFLLFGTGKIICTGARNLDDIHTALARFKEKLEGVGLEVNPTKKAS